MVDPLPGVRLGALAVTLDLTPDFLIDRYNSLDRLLGVTAWIQRFAYNCTRGHAKRLGAVLSAEERQNALLTLIRVVQAASFERELEILRKGGAKLQGVIARLNPFLDESGLIRVGGRLRNANLAFGIRHPILLPKSSPLVTLLVSDRHVKNAHAGCNALLAILQRDYWILSARRTIRSIVFRCKPCDRLKAATMQPQMGDLPVDHVDAWTSGGAIHLPSIANSMEDQPRNQ